MSEARGPGAQPARCPSCAAPMEPRDFERLYGRTLTLDLCGACHAIWFDGDELLQLTPGATLQLHCGEVRAKNLFTGIVLPGRNFFAY